MKLYALIDSNNFVRFVELQKEFPYTSFPTIITSECLPENIFEVEQAPTPNCEYSQTYIKNNYAECIDGTWVQGYTVVNLTEQELLDKNNTEAISYRNYRNKLLTDSDWTQVADAPVDKQAWAIYRQALRDITNQPGFPTEITWPTKPE